jgi:uncharacterized protein (TIGR02996 family)
VNLASALASLLERWRAHRAPELADAIDRVSAIASLGRDPIADQKTWLVVEKKADPADLDRLLAFLVASPCKDARVRLAKLAARPADPRFAAALARLFDTQPFTSDPNRPFWTPIPRLLVELGDVRAVALLRPVLARLRPTVNFRRWLIEKIGEVIAKLSAVERPSLPKAEQAQLAALVAEIERAPKATARAAGKQSEDALLAAIWAAPDDDAPREVYADWLTQRGDPRGVFISLQLARARGTIDAAGKKREKELLTKHRKDWHAPLTSALAFAHSHFERGFVCSAIIDLPKTVAAEGLERHPAWSTIREFRIVDGDDRDRELIAHLQKQGAVRKEFNATGAFLRGIK